LKKDIFFSTMTTLNFAGGATLESVDEQLVEALKMLNQFPEKALRDFVDANLAFLRDPKDVDLIASLDKVSKTHGIKNKKILKKSVRGSLLIFREALKRNLNAAQISKDLQVLGVDKEKAEIVTSSWSKEYGYIKASMLASTLQVHKLVDMEWKFGVTSATDEMERVGTTFLQIKFVIAKGDDEENSETESVYMELSLQQFYELLGQLEKVKSLTDLMST
jgi:hypothetical protein